MSKRKQAPTPKAVDTWTYWITRDSIRGELSGMCGLWHVKPMRVKHSYRATWVSTDERAPGFLGEHSCKDVARWFGAERVPETDIMLVKVSWGVTQRMLDEAKP